MHALSAIQRHICLASKGVVYYAGKGDSSTSNAFYYLYHYSKQITHRKVDEENKTYVFVKDLIDGLLNCFF